MNDTNPRPAMSPPAPPAPAPAPLPPGSTFEEWQARLGKRTLVRHVKNEDNIFECIPIDTAAPNFVRMGLAGGHKEWRSGDKHIIVADLKVGLIDELQIAHDQEKQALMAEIETLRAMAGAPEAAAASASGLQKQVASLTGQLDSANDEIKAKSAEIEKFVSGATIQISEAKAKFTDERDAHERTKTELSQRLAERDEVIASLRQENARHVGDKVELTAQLDRARRDLSEDKAATRLASAPGTVPREGSR